MKRNLLPRKAWFMAPLVMVAALLAPDTSVSQTVSDSSAIATNTTSFAVGRGPGAVVFDGANIWVANQFGNSVTKLRASDGVNLGNFDTGVRPTALAYDGSNVWVA